RRVVDEHVDRAVRLARGVDEPLAFRDVRDVHGDRVRLATLRADVRDGRLERAGELMLAFAQRARRAHDTPPFRGEEPSDLGADAATRPGDHDHLPVELSHHRPPSTGPAAHASARGRRIRTSPTTVESCDDIILPGPATLPIK